MNRKESSKTACARSSCLSVKRIVGGAVIALAVVGLLTQLHDIRRYVNMVRM